MSIIMSNFIRRLVRIWLENISPHMMSSMTSFSTTWAGVCALTTYVLIYVSQAVLQQEAFAFDTRFLLQIHQFSNPALDRVMLAITRLGNPEIVVPFTILLCFLLLWKNYKTEAIFFFVNACGGAVLSDVLKLTFQKPRPDLWPQLISEMTFSYPSGHALGAMVLYGFFSYVLAQRYSRWAIAFYGIAALLIVAIGFSRLYLGVHWPTDVVGGYSVGLLWITVCIMMMRFFQRKTAQLETSKH